MSKPPRPQATAFMEALLNALDSETPVGPFVPTAFRVLAPVKVDATSKAGGVLSASSPWQAKLPPLALQQLLDIGIGSAKSSDLGYPTRCCHRCCLGPRWGGKHQLKDIQRSFHHP